jgi:hypothetical protein
MDSYPLNTYPSRIEPEIVKALLELKQFDQEYPADLLAARRAAFIVQVKKTCPTGMRQVRS